jgi:hypothetical protein
MSEWTLDWLTPCFTVYKDQLMALGIILGDPDSATKAFTDVKIVTPRVTKALIILIRPLCDL